MSIELEKVSGGVSLEGGEYTPMNNSISPLNDPTLDDSYVSFRDAVCEMVDSYDEKAAGDSAFTTTDTITLKEVARYASTGDMMFKWVGFSCGIFFGAGMPAM